MNIIKATMMGILAALNKSPTRNPIVDRMSRDNVSNSYRYIHHRSQQKKRRLARSR